MSIAKLIIVSILLSVGSTYNFGNKFLLEKVHSLTFKRGVLTAGVRTNPILQLSCASGSSCVYAPYINEVVCKNIGLDSYGKVRWLCSTETALNLAITNPVVSCEGYSGKGDPYKLVGSCGLKYELARAPLRPRQTVTRDIFGGLFCVIGLLFCAIYVLFNCFQETEYYHTQPYQIHRHRNYYTPVHTSLPQTYPDNSLHRRNVSHTVDPAEVQTHVSEAVATSEDREEKSTPAQVYTSSINSYPGYSSYNRNLNANVYNGASHAQISAQVEMQTHVSEAVATSEDRIEKVATPRPATPMMPTPRSEKRVIEAFGTTEDR